MNRAVQGAGNSAVVLRRVPESTLYLYRDGPLLRMNAEDSPRQVSREQLTCSVLRAKSRRKGARVGGRMASLSPSSCMSDALCASRIEGTVRVTDSLYTCRSSGEYWGPRPSVRVSCHTIFAVDSP